MTEIGAGDQRPRYIILGASNVARGIATVVRTWQRNADGPADYYLAIGHGRSYGKRSRVLGRSLPGILQCGLWETLDRDRDEHSNRPTHALITDIGNDIPFGAGAAQIVDWINQTVERLLAQEARVAVTDLPMESIRKISRRRFYIARSILFPRCRMSFEEIMDEIAKVHEGLQDLANRTGISLLPQRGEWFGVDAIHIRYRMWNEAWPAILAPLVGSSERQAMKPDPGLFLYLRSRCPRDRSILGFRHGREQPCGHLRDGSSIFLY